MSNSITKELFSWNEKSAEIEFLLESNGDVIPIEVKAGKSTRTKSLQIFAEKYHPKYQVMLSAKPLAINTVKRKSYYPLYLAGFLSF